MILRLLQIFLLLIVGNLSNSQQSVIVEHHVESVVDIKPTEKKHNQPSNLDYLTATESQPSINNQRNNVRTITTRTFRTTSSNGATKWRCGGGSYINPYNNLLTSKRWKDALRIETAPFRFSHPCDYYVIALRHIIR